MHQNSILACMIGDEAMEYQKSYYRDAFKRGIVDGFPL